MTETHRSEVLLNTIFTNSRGNDFQWRNLYLKQFGVPTYPPTMPKNTSTCAETYPKRCDLRAFVQVGIGEDSEGSQGNATLTRNQRLEVARHPPGIFSLEQYNDPDLFAPNLFDFLLKNKSSMAVGASDRDGSNPSQHRPAHRFSLSVVDESDDQVNPHGLPREILALHYNAWCLLMDNRPLAWLGREITNAGVSADRLRAKLLEIAGEDFSHLSFTLNEEELASSHSFSFLKPIAVSEEEASKRVFDNFSPYFGVISDPNIVGLLRDQFMAACRAQARGLTGAAADLVGLPLFSQFRTWKEAYESRKAWSCAPFSFFLIYDTSYNYAHISALYVMLALIQQYAHTHTAKCLPQKDEAVVLHEASWQIGEYKHIRKTVERQLHMCPLRAIQKLSEDLLIAFEATWSKSTLTMILRTCDFLTTCVLDPKTSTKFLSREALFRQSEFVLPGFYQRRAGAGASSINSPDAFTKKDADESTASTENPNAPWTTNLTSIDTAFATQSFTERELELMFDLSLWFVDAATANSRIPLDPTQLPSMQSPQGPSERLDGSHLGDSSGMPSLSRVSRPTSHPISPRRSASEAAGKASRSAIEYGYIPGRTQQFSAISSIVEVLTLYQMRCASMHKAMLSHQSPLQPSQLRSSGVPSPPLTTPTRSKFRASVAPLDPCDSLEDPDRRATQVSMSATILSTPLIMVHTYIRLHGASWLKHIFGRMLNILRRESVILYVNRLDLDDPFQSSQDDSFAMEGSSTSMDSGGTKSNQSFSHTLERLEDLISQDILFVLNEFFNALHGKRSATRLPEGITRLITQFCTTIHYHLLSNLPKVADVSSTMSNAPIPKQITQFLFHIKQKHLATKAFRHDVVADYDIAKLICTIEQYRIAKFILFDCWIIPALNNVISFGFLAETSSKHVRWNIDAFARYLKILVNGPFMDHEKIRERERSNPSIVSYSTRSSHSMHPRSSYGTYSGSIPRRTAARKTTYSTTKEGASVLPPLTLTLPRYISGIYDISSGSLVRLYSEVDPHIYSNLPALPDSKVPLEGSLPSLDYVWTRSYRSSNLARLQREAGAGGGGHNSRLQAMDSASAKFLFYRTMDEASWEDISPLLRGLNESLGLIGYDPEENVFDLQLNAQDSIFGKESPMHLLDAFCRRCSHDHGSTAVTPEFEVLPSVAASCIDKVFELMTGTHPLVERAMSMSAFPGKMSFSPYLSTLSGVLLHPKTAMQALDNVRMNNKRFFHLLMQPVRDRTIIDLVTSLVQNPDDAPLIDSNALVPLMASVIPTPDGGNLSTEAASSHAKLIAEMRKLQLQSSFLVTGCPATTHGMKALLHRAGSFSPYIILNEGSLQLQRDMNLIPRTFDPWWRAMVAALLVKVTSVFSECSGSLTQYFETWCHFQLDINRRENRALTKVFLDTKGGDVMRKKVPRDRTQHALTGYAIRPNQSKECSEGDENKPPEATPPSKKLRKRKRKKKKAAEPSKKSK